MNKTKNNARVSGVFSAVMGVVLSLGLMACGQTSKPNADGVEAPGVQALPSPQSVAHEFGLKFVAGGKDHPERPDLSLERMVWGAEQLAENVLVPQAPSERLYLVANSEAHDAAVVSMEGVLEKRDTLNREGPLGKKFTATQDPKTLAWFVALDEIFGEQALSTISPADTYFLRMTFFTAKGEVHRVRLGFRVVIALPQIAVREIGGMGLALLNGDLRDRLALKQFELDNPSLRSVRVWIRAGGQASFLGVTSRMTFTEHPTSAPTGPNYWDRYRIRGTLVLDRVQVDGVGRNTQILDLTSGDQGGWVSVDLPAQSRITLTFNAQPNARCPLSVDQDVTYHWMETRSRCRRGECDFETVAHSQTVREGMRVLGRQLQGVLNVELALADPMLQNPSAIQDTQMQKLELVRQLLNSSRLDISEAMGEGAGGDIPEGCRGVL